MITPSSNHQNQDTTLLADMRQRWSDLIDQIEVDRSAAAEVFEDLVALYGGPERFYHDLSHIQDLLVIVAGFKAHIQDYTAMRLAIWFHDAIYDSRAGDNEEQSAGLAGRVLNELGLPTELVTRVQELILATAGHHAVPHDLDVQILLDADLSPLGAPPEVFAEDTLDLEREYAWMPEPAYRAARKRILKGFLGRERLYQTEWFYDRLESQARRNLTGALESLARPGVDEEP